MSDSEKNEEAMFRPDWAVRTQAELDWALSCLAAIEARMARNEELAGAAIARAEAWLKAENDREAHRTLHLRSRIAAYAGQHRAQLLSGARGKTAKFPSGTVAWRTKPGALRVEDAAALLEWAKAQTQAPQLVRRKEEPAVAEIKAYAEERNLIPPGMRQEESREEITIEAAGDALAKVG